MYLWHKRPEIEKLGQGIFTIFLFINAICVQEKFSMSKEEFQASPRWKQVEMKKVSGLFWLRETLTIQIAVILHYYNLYQIRSSAKRAEITLQPPPFPIIEANKGFGITIILLSKMWFELFWKLYLVIRK